MSHGRATTERRAQQARQRFEPLARYLVSMGFVVLVPTRVGYGDTYGDFDPEDHGGCNAMRVEPVATAASDQVIAALSFARTLPYVDASRWVAMGQSVGGLTTVAVAWRNPPGLVGAINFAGGSGGDPERRPGPAVHAGADRAPVARQRQHGAGADVVAVLGQRQVLGRRRARSAGTRRSPKAAARPSCTRCRRRATMATTASTST